MVSDAYTITKSRLSTLAITDTDPIPPKMADTDLSIWYRCIPNLTLVNSYGLIRYIISLMRISMSTAV